MRTSKSPPRGHPLRRLGLAALAGAAAMALVPTAADAATPTSCRASAARVSVPRLAVVEPVVANSASSPCATDAQQLAGVAPIGPLTVTAPEATTRAVPGVIAASAGVANVGLTLGGLPVGIGAVHSEQTVSCAAGQSTSSGSSTVDALTILGVPVPIIAGQTLDLNVGLIRVRTNIVTGSVRQALVLDAGTTQVVLGEAEASGDACATLATGTPGGGGNGGGGGDDDDDPTTADGVPGGGTGSAQICATGSTYRAADNMCVITTTSAPGPGGTTTTTTTVVGAPYAGPSGGTVLTLQAALALVKAHKLADSACLHGKGPNYVLLGTTKGRDLLTGTNGPDRILALAGNDGIGGGRGADCIDGGSGNDSLTGADGNDRVLGMSGNDHLNGGPGTDALDGGAGNDTINTAYGADHVKGGAGRDAINAATSGPAAHIDAGSGRDIVRINTNERRYVRHAETVHTLR